MKTDFQDEDFFGIQKIKCTSKDKTSSSIFKFKRLSNPGMWRGFKRNSAYYWTRIFFLTRTTGTS